MVSIYTIEKIRKFNRYYANILGKIEQEIYNQNFTLTEARVITEIHNRKGCTATDIRETLGIDKGYMSRIVQRLESESETLLYKTQLKEDKRQYSIVLTEKGIRVFDELVERANQEVGKMIQHLSHKEQSFLVSSMETIESINLDNEYTLPKIVIRPFQPGDVGLVAQLHGRLYDESYQFGTIFEYYVMKGLTEFLIDHHGGNLWIAEINGVRVGFIAITKTDDQVAQIRWFILDENYQGLGIGKKLIETALHFL